MKYKTMIRLAAAAAAALMLCSCGAEPKEAEIDPDALPTAKEIVDYRSNHSEQEYLDYSSGIVETISDMGDEKMYGELEKVFEEWLSEQKELMGGEISFYNTNKVNYACGQKWFRQIGVEADIYYDAGSVTDEAGLVSDVFDSLCSSLEETAVGYYKLAQVDMRCYDTGSQVARNERSVDNVPDAGDFSQFYDDIDWQPEGEKEALAIAYRSACELGEEYAGEGRSMDNGIVIPEVMLTRFGVSRENTGIEMTIEWSSVPGDIDYQQVIRDSAAGMYDDMMSDAAAKQYISDNGGMVRISYTGGEGDHTFVIDDQGVRTE